jgi:5-methylthioribose kinase
MGFDTGAFIANLFLNYVSQPGHSNKGNANDVGEDEYSEWVLLQIKAFWETFCAEFRNLWNDPAEHTGFLYGRETLGGDSPSEFDGALVDQAQTNFLNELLSETLGFAGMKMLRRVIGIAHVEDLECIDDVNVKVLCERHALVIAKVFIKSSSSFASIDDAIQLARRTKRLA